MKKIFRTIGMLLLCGALVLPMDADAQDRGRNHGGGTRNTTRPATRPSTRPGGGNSGSHQRPSQPSRPAPGQGNHNRPGSGHGNGNSQQRPGQGNHNNGNRPGQGNHNNGNRPGQGHGNGFDRPGGGTFKPGRPSGDHRPGGNRPGGGMRPGNDRPGGPGGPSHNRPPQHHRPPYHGHWGPGHGPWRPTLPPPRPFMRPAPPPAWRPVPGWRPFHTILGVALGTTINLSVNALINSGYTINSYGNDQIYLANAPMLNLVWPDAVLYFNSLGQLYGSRFVYSTAGYNMNQYNMAYTTLTNSYGPPVSIENLATGVVASWWGPDNQFIRLSYQSDYNNGGYLRYFTTLSFGN